MKETKFNFPVK